MRARDCMKKNAHAREIFKQDPCAREHERKCSHDRAREDEKTGVCENAHAHLRVINRASGHLMQHQSHKTHRTICHAFRTECYSTTMMSHRTHFVLRHTLHTVRCTMPHTWYCVALDAASESQHTLHYMSPTHVVLRVTHTSHLPRSIPAGELVKVFKSQSCSHCTQ